MHLLIPFASVHSERGTQALRALRLKNLPQLLAHLSPTERIGSDEFSLSPPHEAALAQALGWQAADGALPWAARKAREDGVDVGTQAWGQLTPVHLHVGADHVSLPDPSALNLSAQDSHTLFEAVRHLFESDGWGIAWGAPDRWYVTHDSLDGLPTASLDRVIGRNIDHWLAAAPQARQIRRLQNEVQMLLYQQPLNDERVGQGALPVNSFWFSGCGRAQATTTNVDVTVADALRDPALRSDWDAWAEAWQALDAGPVRQALGRARQGEPVTLSLCGERVAQVFITAQATWLSRWAKRLSAPPIAPILEAL